jgi:hypothetical protein
MADARVSVLIDIRSRLAELERATAGFGNLVKGVVAAASAYIGFRAVMRGGREILTMGADLDHLSKQTSVAVADLATLRQAFADNGVEPQRAGKSINDLQRRIADAARGMGEGRQALRDLNLEATEVVRLSPADQFALIGDRIAGIENPAQRTAIAVKLLGESGVALMPLFASGGAIEDAKVTLGQMPEVLERNAVQFERIDTLLGRIPNKSRQLFAGLGDQLAGYLTGPLETLNRLDLTGLGQRIGAFIALGLESIQDGTFSQFISLAIEAGFEQGMKGARRVLDWFGTDGAWLKPIATGVMTIGVGFGKWISDALGMVSLLTAYLTSGFTFAFEKAREGWGSLKGVILEGLAAIINFFATRLERLLNSAIQWANKIPGVKIAEASLGRVASQSSGEGFKARTYADILEESQAAVVARADARKAALESNLADTLRIIGVETEAIEGQASASERLNDLIQERIRLREEEGASAPRSNTAPLPDAIGQLTFADKSQERFDDFTAGRGDFGVETWTAAKAAMMDYVVTAGTVAQQVYGAIGGIASSLTEGISQSITGLIEETMTWGDALRNIGSTIVSSIITAFSDMAAQFIVKRTLMFILGRKLDTAEVASNVAKNAAIATSEVATATTTAVAWTPAALVKSIATFGIAAIIGLALFAAAMAAFDKGGYTGGGGRLEPAGIVHRGEFVMPADVVSKRGPGFFYALMDSLRFDSPMPAAALAGYSTGGFVGTSAPAAEHVRADGGRPATNRFNIGLFNDPAALQRWAQSQDGETVILDVLRRNRHEFQG